MSFNARQSDHWRMNKTTQTLWMQRVEWDECKWWINVYWQIKHWIYAKQYHHANEWTRLNTTCFVKQRMTDWLNDRLIEWRTDWMIINLVTAMFVFLNDLFISTVSTLLYLSIHKYPHTCMHTHTHTHTRTCIRAHTKCICIHTHAGTLMHTHCITSLDSLNTVQHSNTPTTPYNLTTLSHCTGL